MLKSKKTIIIIVLVLLLIVESVFLILGLSKPNVPVVMKTPATVRGKIMTDLGEMIMANIIVEDSDGKTALYLTNQLSGYEIKLSEGDYKFHYTRGMQFSTVTKSVSVEDYKNYYLEDIRLVRLYDSEKYNFFPGDLHMHTIFSDGTQGVEPLVRANIAQGLTWALLSDHNDNTGMSEWLQANRLPYDIVNGQKKYFNPIAGVEVTTGYGHFQSIGSSAIIEQWDIDLSLGENPYDEVNTILQEIKRNGGIVQLNHPYSTGAMGFNNYNGLWNLVDNFDTIEIWNGYFETPGYVPPEGVLNQNRKTTLKWFELLNEGKKIYATGGTDLHSYEGTFNPNLYKGESKAYEKLLKQTGQYAGMPSTYAYLPQGLNTANILTAVEQGNTFVTNGVLIFADVDGKTYGQTTTIGENKKLNIEAFCKDGIDKINIYKNGIMLKTVDLAEVTTHTSVIELGSMVQKDWIVIEAYGTGVLYGITNPIFFN